MFLPFSFLMCFLLVFGTVLSLSSVSWLGVWVGLEMNMLCFLPVLVHLSSFQIIEGSVKYFLVQSLGSIFLLLSGLVTSVGFVFYVDGIFFSLFLVSLFLKLGVFPLHWWVSSVLGSLGWFGVFLLSTWQKVGPFFLFLFFSGFSFLFFFFSSFSSVVGGFCGVGQANSRFLLAYSTVGHLGWMVSVGFFSFFFLCFIFLFIFFFLFFWFCSYDILMYPVLLNFFFFSFFFFLLFFICLFSLCGIPPFLGFFSKFFVFFILVVFWMFFFFLFLLLLGSLLSLYFYLGLFFSFFFFYFSFFTSFFFPIFFLFLLFISSFFFFFFFFLWFFFLLG
uniref:NADH-ubiquinone oxidoreductase chain 2 n=1 Tax=Gononemertes parasita TaxID=649615 RepID=A0A075CEX8_9BILA|nr:NADH dehydrogenase subunit 2 [Gononemertes parasita]AGZ63897.1 NADH dehydrogenase subunit 2 [Gononemertes parasita]